MTREERMHAAAVDRYWDALALGGRSPGTDLLDHETAGLIERLWRLSAPPSPDVARERVWQRLRGHEDKEGGIEAITRAEIPSSSPWGAAHPNGRLPFRPTVRGERARWRGMAGQLATAAILILAVLGTLFAAGPLRPTRPGTEPTGLPAVITAPATPTPEEPAAETLLEITIPAEMLPQGDRISSVLDHATSPAGSTGSWQEENSVGQPGLRVHHVLDGSVTFRAEDGTRVVRAGTWDMPEDVPAGTEVTLETGDTWMVGNETVFETTNPAQEPAQILVWVIVNLEEPAEFLNNPLPSSWIENHYVLDQPVPGMPGIELPAGPTTLRIRRVELPAKGVVAAPVAGLQYGLGSPVNPEGTPVAAPSVASQPSGKLVNIGRKPATVFVLSLEPAATEAGTTPAGTATP